MVRGAGDSYIMTPLLLSKPSAVPPEKLMCLAHISVIHAVASKTFYDKM